MLFDAEVDNRQQDRINLSGHKTAVFSDITHTAIKAYLCITVYVTEQKFPKLLLLLLPFYGPLDSVWDYPGELAPGR